MDQEGLLILPSFCKNLKRLGHRFRYLRNIAELLLLSFLALFLHRLSADALTFDGGNWFNPILLSCSSNAQPLFTGTLLHNMDEWGANGANWFNATAPPLVTKDWLFTVCGGGDRSPCCPAELWLSATAFDSVSLMMMYLQHICVFRWRTEYSPKFRGARTRLATARWPSDSIWTSFRTNKGSNRPNPSGHTAFWNRLQMCDYGVCRMVCFAGDDRAMSDRVLFKARFKMTGERLVGVAGADPAARCLLSGSGFWVRMHACAHTKNRHTTNRVSTLAVFLNEHESTFLEICLTCLQNIRIGVIFKMYSFTSIITILFEITNPTIGQYI